MKRLIEPVPLLTLTCTKGQRHILMDNYKLVNKNKVKRLVFNDDIKNIIANKNANEEQILSILYVLVLTGKIYDKTILNVSLIYQLYSLQLIYFNEVVVLCDFDSYSIFTEINQLMFVKSNMFDTLYHSFIQSSEGTKDIFIAIMYYELYLISCLAQTHILKDDRIYNLIKSNKLIYSLIEKDYKDNIIMKKIDNLIKRIEQSESIVNNHHFDKN